MRIDEISDLDKSYLTIKGIQYSFKEDYENISNVYTIIGSSISRQNILLSDIDIVCSNIMLLLEQNFQDADPDIMIAKDIYNKLLEIKNKL